MPQFLLPLLVKRECIWQQEAEETAVAGRNLERIRASEWLKSLEV